MARFGPAGPYPLHGEKMPRAARDYFKIAVHRIDPKTITEKTGLRRVAAQDIMSKLADRLAENADGSWAFPENLSKQEIKLVECVSSHFVVKPAFGADRLFDDFVATLKSNGLITKDELSQNRDRLRALAQLFAVSVMHNCVIDIGDGTTTQLKARPEPGERQIRVNASVPVEQTPGLFVAASMFSADVDPALHCDPGLAVNQDWNFEIELSFDGRLTALR